MSVHFEKLRIKDIRKETSDCVSIAFDVPEPLHSAFQYKQGQYITLRSYLHNEELRRSYSLCSAPYEKEWRIAVKKTPGGLFSAYANDQLKPGDVLDVMPPMGRFYTEVNATHKKRYVLVAAGSGITPVISILKTILHSEPDSECTLVYGNRNRHSIVFREELEALKNKYISRFRLIHILSREITDATINTGRIDAIKCDELFTRMVSTQADEYFICGPEEMTLCVKEFLLQKDVDSHHIHLELFTAGNAQKRNAQAKASADNNEPASRVTVKLDGRSFDFDLSYNSDNILDAALHHGADLPYSCKGGVCCTCRAKLVEGEVDMEVNYALEAEEVAQGYILTCQSHPKSERVVVDFDVN
ncbi:ring-1,2-phenylacetyl-CoA epoxidase subunit PaaE [Filimonas lacunae]|uniref:Ring-1,2-phenylacetyl-CoA epoxidase subunit PaaE n=1 Tax=Filimonas lacunae TaxID=477680 RepID=A0A173MNS2_9BACT|nr:1,2-phenylacetyl-CoA epoxidase subunit PaaE [Filimonas lacunae]BAV09315.1 phenylacetate-CoA oxygenase/reductase, PaaK subunit [Filimonas lacunae]SIS70994.1 ring-1,2-phenylacetyl-CoA epoxidase subunit PaaE [Filimonas lacunae]